MGGGDPPQQHPAGVGARRPCYALSWVCQPGRCSGRAEHAWLAPCGPHPLRVRCRQPARSADDFIDPMKPAIPQHGIGIGAHPRGAGFPRWGRHGAGGRPQPARSAARRWRSTAGHAGAAPRGAASMRVRHRLPAGCECAPPARDGAGDKASHSSAVRVAKMAASTSASADMGIQPLAVILFHHVWPPQGPDLAGSCWRRLEALTISGASAAW